MSSRTSSTESKKPAKSERTQTAPPSGAKRKSAKEKVVEVSLKSQPAPRKGKEERKKLPPKIAAKLAAQRAAAEEAAVAPVTPDEDSLKLFRRISEFRRLESRRTKSKKVSTANFLAKPPVKGKKMTIDLRVHSPGTIGYFEGGGIEPGPALLRLAKVKGLDMLGITDFYDAGFIDKLPLPLDRGSDISILPGLDFRCALGACKEVYITALFPEHYRGTELRQVLADLAIPSGVDKSYCVEAPFRTVIETIERHGGVVIPSRVDKTPYRQLSIPILVQEFGFHTFDLVHPENMELFKERWPAGQFTFVSFSNATALAQIGTRSTKVKLVSSGFEGLKELVARRILPEILT